VALQFGYSVPPVAELLDSSAVVIAQLAHAAGKSIFCHEGWWCGSSQISLGFLVYVYIVFTLFSCNL